MVTSSLTYKSNIVLFLPARWTKKGRPLISPYQIGDVKFCSWCCEHKVPPGRRKYCGYQCALSASWLTRWARVRYLIFLRDRKCVVCGLAVKKHVKPKDKLYEYLVKLGYDLTRSVYEVDHIIPKCEGGAEMKEDNLRLLCQLCHKKETAKLRKRLQCAKIAS
jgi:5-methylcytosine-specific restriction endonuclease McrA